MNILHIAPHLGGGVGNAHAAIAEALVTSPEGPSGVRHTYALLEPPRDIVYTDRIRAAGCEIHVAPDLSQLAALADDADIVQLEWWNHPRIYDILVKNALPNIRLIVWLHISGLVPPLVPRALAELADQTLFTSPCSFAAANLKTAILDRPEAFHIVNSGFGFNDARHVPRSQGEPLRFGYLGTLDFTKMHPNFFDFVDAVEADICVHLWGRHDPEGEVAERAASMRYPHRVRFEDYTSDPEHVLSRLDVLIYLLAPYHYGTAENALVEAMSAGAIPIVFANVAENYIVRDGKTGFVVQSQSDFASCIANLLRDPGRLASIRSAAQTEIARLYSPLTSVHTLDNVYNEVMRQPKRTRDFEAALGADARAWFLSALSEKDSSQTAGSRLLSHIKSKGSLGHFRSCFPQDESLAAIARQVG